MKHTPGPWGFELFAASRQNTPWAIMFGDDECVAESVYLEADARLIAAAPDLLAACKLRIEDNQCAVVLDGPHADCPCWYCVCCRAIKKAEVQP